MQNELSRGPPLVQIGYIHNLKQFLLAQACMTRVFTMAAVMKSFKGSFIPCFDLYTWWWALSIRLVMRDVVKARQVRRCSMEWVNVEGVVAGHPGRKHLVGWGRVSQSLEVKSWSMVWLGRVWERVKGHQQHRRTVLATIRNHHQSNEDTEW